MNHFPCRCFSNVGNMQLIKLHKHKHKVYTYCTRDLHLVAAALMQIWSTQSGLMTLNLKKISLCTVKLNPVWTLRILRPCHRLVLSTMWMSLERGLEDPSAAHSYLSVICPAVVCWVFWSVSILALEGFFYKCQKYDFIEHKTSASTIINTIQWFERIKHQHEATKFKVWEKNSNVNNVFHSPVRIKSFRFGSLI